MDENRGRAVIYQWINLITGEIYVGSGINGATRLSNYWTPSHLARDRRIYNSITMYTHHNFALAILEDVGPSSQVSNTSLLVREQFYLDIVFITHNNIKLNLAPTAGNTLGFKHAPEFGLSRLGKGNPMYGREFSPEFLAMQTRDKTGANNPQYGVIKTSETVAKLTKLVYVYNAVDNTFLGEFSTVNCAKEFKIGKDTLQKYLKTGLPFKGLIYTRTKRS
jgi:group I intron endonuclease